jgi:hypothetical protein
LSDTAFQLMRNTAIAMMRDLGNFAGGCNVQFALNPQTEEIIAIEINPACEPFIGAGIKGNRLPNCQDSGQAGHRFYAG